MSIVKKTYSYVSEEVGIGMVAILLVALIAIAMALLIGSVAYFLLSVAFPEYITFGWDWWRIIAIGILTILMH